MKHGAFSVSLAVKDLEASKTFYEKFGFQEFAGDVDAAFPFSVLEEERAVNYKVNDKDVAVLFKLGTTSALDRTSISRSRDVGATGL